MSIDVLLNLVEQYKEAAQLIEAAQAEQEQLKIQIREALSERSTNYLEVGCHKVRLSDFSSTRLDSKAIKAVAPDLYDQYSKTVTGTRLSITCSKVWQAGGENKYEINISSATLDRPIEETASTLLHEMIHEYCLENSIKDTSNNGVYHNKRFKAEAEAHGLTVDHHEKYGWTITSPSEELLDFIIFQGWQDIQMGERLAWSDMFGTGNGSKAPGSSETGAPKPPKAKSSTRRWVCPKCHTIIRSTKEVRVICADCMEMFVMTE